MRDENFAAFLEIFIPEVVDLPTPPLPEATTITCLTPAIGLFFGRPRAICCFWCCSNDLLLPPMPYKNRKGVEEPCIMTYTGRLFQKGLPFSGFRYIKRFGFHKLTYMKGSRNLSVRAFNQNISNRHLIAVSGNAWCFPLILFNNFISFRSCTKALRNVDHLMLDVPFSRTDIFKNSFFVYICHLWNDLPRLK